MKRFYLDNQKIIHKLFINQIAVSALGLMVFFPVNAITVRFGFGEIPFLLAGLFTAAMYFFVIYDAYWEWGTKYISKKPENGPTAKTAFLTAAFAYIPTIIITLIYGICCLLKVGAIVPIKWVLLLLCNGMHFGTVTFCSGYILTEYKDIAHFGIFLLLILLTLAVCTIGFKVGRSGKTMFAGYFHKKPNKHE